MPSLSSRLIALGLLMAGATATAGWGQTPSALPVETSAAKALGVTYGIRLDPHGALTCLRSGGGLRCGFEPGPAASGIAPGGPLGWRYRAPVYRAGTLRWVAPLPEAVVRWREPPAPNVLQALAGAGFVPLKSSRFDPALWLLQTRDGNPPQPSAITALTRSPRVLWAEAHFARSVSRGGYTVNDPLFRRQWHFANTGQQGAVPGNDIRALDAWSFSTGAPGTVIAILDDGIEMAHPDLGASRMVHPYDFLDDDSDPSPDPLANPEGPGGPAGASYSHGTAVAGVATAQGNNAAGIHGLCPECSVMPLRVIGLNRIGAYISDFELGEAIRYAAANGAAVLINSFGPDLGDPVVVGDEPGFIPAPAAIAEAIRVAGTEGRGGLGCVVIFAAGNANTEASRSGILTLPQVLGVGAINDQGVKAFYSNFGPGVGLVAPSGGWGTGYDGARLRGIWSTDLTGPLGRNPGDAALGDTFGDYFLGFTGTSAAAPQAAGVAALMLSRKPGLAAAEVTQMLIDSADKISYEGITYNSAGFSDQVGYGRLNALRAMQLATGSQCMPTTEVCDGKDNDCDGEADNGGVCDGTAAFCAPCRGDSECAEPDARCLTAPGGSRFCGRDCSLGAQACPPGTGCAETGDDDAGIALQCLPPAADCSLAGVPFFCAPCASDAECPAGSGCFADRDGRHGCLPFCDPETFVCPSGSVCAPVSRLEVPATGTAVNTGDGGETEDAGDAGTGGKDANESADAGDGGDGGIAGPFACLPETFRCVAGTGALCEPCRYAGDCVEPGGFCLALGGQTGGRFCGRGCDKTPCPPLYRCAAIAGPNGGGITRQCIPESGSCPAGQPVAGESCALDEDCVDVGNGLGVCVPAGFDGTPTSAEGTRYGLCALGVPCAADICVATTPAAESGVCLAPCNPTGAFANPPCAAYGACLNTCGPDEACLAGCAPLKTGACDACLASLLQCIKDFECLEAPTLDTACLTENCASQLLSCYGAGDAFAGLGCGPGLLCAPLVGSGGVCLEPGFDGTPHDGGAIHGTCDSTTPCERGLCIALSAGATSGVCLDPCDPAAAAAEPGDGGLDGGELPDDAEVTQSPDRPSLVPFDAGVRDAGIFVILDAGVPEPDAGAPMDAGHDAGFDAGAMPPDGGAQAKDAGPARDAGDTGPPEIIQAPDPAAPGPPDAGFAVYQRPPAPPDGGGTAGSAAPTTPAPPSCQCAGRANSAPWAGTWILMAFAMGLRRALSGFARAGRRTRPVS